MYSVNNRQIPRQQNPLNAQTNRSNGAYHPYNRVNQGNNNQPLPVQGPSTRIDNMVHFLMPYPVVQQNQMDTRQYFPNNGLIIPPIYGNSNSEAAGSSKVFNFVTNNMAPVQEAPKYSEPNQNMLAQKSADLQSRSKEIPSAKPMQIETKVNFNKSDEQNKMVYFWTGTAERAIKWHKLYQNFALYEVIASIIGLQDGSVRMQKIMLLRDQKGPILQVVHYSSDSIKIDNFYVGQMLRCVGRMVGPNIMHAFSIRDARPEEIANLQRLCYISDHAVSRALSKQ